MPSRSAALTTEFAAPPVVDPLLRHFTGDGLLNLLAARAEVMAALRDGALPEAALPTDALRPAAIPSVAAGALHDRVLAEIDHDGFLFAADPLDEPYFNRRAIRHLRHHNRLHVVLLEGRVCVRKRFRRARYGVRRWGGQPVPFTAWATRSFWTATGLYLFNEAAALLRIRDLPFVPKLRRIDLEDQAIYVDFLDGECLRHQAAQAGAPVHDLDLAQRRDDLAGLTGRELEKREVVLFDATGPGDYRREIAAMARALNDRGVAPLDIKLGNFIRGRRSGALYWIDFEVSRIASQPRWLQDFLLQRELLEYLFELTERGYAF
ncbi:MAG TPA: hypothetical protein VLW85_17345 [Myxococcales bacterium]|nr:hypothetical protein [Myxococcales bacterium]